MSDRSVLKILRFLLPVFFASVVSTSVSLAQLSTTGTITGSVTDKSGAVVPQASIAITNNDTGEKRTTTSNADGTYVVPALPVGTYTVTVSKSGFQTYVEKEVVIHPTEVVALNPVLRVGEVTTKVAVSASPARVETSTPEISNEVSGYQATTLPLNGRNFESLGFLMPGVVNLTPGTALGGGSDQVTNPLSINGMGNQASLFIIDGIWNTDSGAMENVSITPPPEAIEEVRVLQNNFGVQYSLMGSSVIVVQTRSGTNAFHGSAYEYLRNDALDSRNFFSPSVPPLKQNIFGYSLGGPVYIPGHYNTNKDKTFFFWSQQWRYQNIASTVLGATPTSAMRGGDFSSLCASGFAANGICNDRDSSGNVIDQLTNPSTGQPFAGNVIPQGMLNQSSLALMNALMQPPNNPAGGFLNYINLNPQINRQRDDQIKIEHNFGSRLRLMGEFFDEHQRLNYPNQSWLGSPFTTNSFTDDTDSYVAQMQLTAMLTPAMVNTVSVATSQYVDGFVMHGLWQKAQLPGFQESLPYSGFLSNRLPEVDFTGGWPSIGVDAPFPLLHASDLEDMLTDDWSLLRGNHYIQAGGTILFGTKRQPDYAQTNGDWVFTGMFSGNSIADFLLGEPASLTQASGETRPYSQYPLFSPYIQDRWKATRRLTLTAGLRFLFEPEPHAQRDYVTMFDPADYNAAHAPIVNADGTITPTANYDPLNGLIFNGVNGVPLNFTTKHQYYWAPSVGFAWDVFGDGKTSLRGGYGISYTRIPTENDCSYVCGNNPPRIESETLITPQYPDAVGGSVAPEGAPSLHNAGLDIQSEQVQSYSLSLQHQFRQNWFASIAGVGNIGRHLNASWDINQPPPDPPYDYNPIINSGTVYEYQYGPYLGYGTISTNLSGSNLYWNALEISVRHPVGHNLFLSGAYTWSHSLSDLGGAQDLYHPKRGYGSGGTPQTLALSAIWSLPWLQHAKGLKGLALGGWKFSDITTIYSGFLLNPGLSVANQGLAWLPDQVAGQKVAGPKTVDEWFNTAAFTAPAWGYFGNAAPGSIHGPGLVNFDMAFHKDFAVTERHKIEFRAELFNIFNHTNFNSVQTAYGAGNYGALNGAADPRIAEFALRYQF
jgi:hypothetical protein